MNAETPNVCANRKIFIVDSDLWAQISITHVINTMFFLFYVRSFVRLEKMRQTSVRVFLFLADSPRSSHGPLCYVLSCKRFPKITPNIAFYVKMKVLIELGAT